MESPGRHSDADAAAVTSPRKSFEERFEKLEKMHQTQNARLDEITKSSEEQFTCITQMLSSIIEGKRKYTEPDEDAGKRARTSVESPQLPGPSKAGASAERSLQRQVKHRARTSAECPKRKRQVSDSDRSSCTRPYGGSDEKTHSMEFEMNYDQNCIDENIRLLCSSKAKDRPQAEEEDENHVLDEIKQEYTVKDLVGKPIGTRKLFSIANNLFLVNMEEGMLKGLNKKYSRPKNCPNMATPKCNSEIWKSSLTSTYRMNQIELQRIEILHVKAAYAVTVASDKIMSSNLLQEQSKELITPLVDALVLLGKATADMNQFRRNNVRSRLPGKMRPLATNVPTGSQWLFDDDLNKRIAQISSINNALSQTFKSNNRQGRYNHIVHQHTINSIKAQKTTNHPGGALL